MFAAQLARLMEAKACGFSGLQNAASSVKLGRIWRHFFVFLMQSVYLSHTIYGPGVISQSVNQAINQSIDQLVTFYM